MMKADLYAIPAAPPFPNNALPLIVYPGVFSPDQAGARVFQALFEKNGWPGAWVDGVYPFYHFHARAHEVLGCARGWARVRLGGPSGRVFTLNAGDAALLPAGLAHCLVEASPDYRIVGSYPRGHSPDLERGDPARYRQAVEEIAGVPRPLTDPVYGPEGPVMTAWA